MAAVTPLPSATVIVLRDAEPALSGVEGLEVLLLRRSAKSSFVRSGGCRTRSFISTGLTVLAKPPRSRTGHSSLP